MKRIYRPDEIKARELTPEEETELILDAREPDGKEALEELSRCFILVATQAARNEGLPTNVPDDVLVSCAHDGLLKAIKDYNPARGARFSSFVYRCAVWCVRRWRETNGYHEARKRALAESYLPTKHLFSNPSSERSDYVTSRLSTVKEVLHKLPARQQEIVGRFLAGQSARDIAAEFDLTPARVGQLIRTATKKLKKLVQS